MNFLTNIRNKRRYKFVAMFMTLSFLNQLVFPVYTYALTGGPSQPEVQSFEPIGTSQMVDLATGDFNYNIPLIDVGGYPVNLSYHAGVTMDQEASWVGLGWTLSTGQINRQMRGLPDDFKGDTMTYDNNLKPNYTVGGTFKFKPHAFGLGKKDGALKKDALSFDVGFGLQYNSYEGPSLTPSAGVSYQLNDHASVAFNVKSTPDGFCISPSTSLSANFSKKSAVDTKLGLNAGVSFNSRQGVKDYNMSTSANIVQNKMMGGWPYAVTGASSSSSNGSVISAVPNTYTPTVRGNFVTENGTFNASFGTEIFGAEGDATINGYHSVQSLVENQTEESAYGYDHTHEALPEDVLDFNREKDGNFSVNSTNLPITNYTYDLYSVQGQGVSGMFRPYRSQVGYVHDNRQVSGSEGGSGGAEIGVGQHQRRGEARAREPLGRGLEQGGLAHQRDELLGIGLARERPEAGAGAAAEKNGSDHGNGLVL